MIFQFVRKRDFFFLDENVKNVHDRVEIYGKTEMIVVELGKKVTSLSHYYFFFPVLLSTTLIYYTHYTFN
jgi:hypothetical protein